jgi:hypothetical protein
MLKLIIIILLLPVTLFADLPKIGEVVQSSGRIDIIAAECSSYNCKRDGKIIYPGDRILSAPSARAKILLKDGTGIEIINNCSFIVENIRRKEKDKPSFLRVQYGTFTINQVNRFTDTSLVIETESAIIKSVSSSLYIIAAGEETAVMVYSSRAGIASTDPSIKRAYVLTEGDQTLVPKNRAPENPDRVDILLRGSWLTKHHLSNDLSRVIIRKQDSSIVDWIFRNRD